MDMLKQLNAAIDYVESSLSDEINFDKMTQIACVTKDSFFRFFSYMTGMTINEYIRRRRLTQAAYDLQDDNLRVIDIAIKYGWESADAFTRAFIKQHGITPTQARNQKQPIKIYPPAHLYIMIKGAEEMNFRLIELTETEVLGVSKQFDGEGYKSKEELRPLMWADNCEDVPG